MLDNLPLLLNFLSLKGSDIFTTFTIRFCKLEPNAK